MKVLITGAAGFLGSHLVDAYLARGARVYGIDNFITGRNENLESARNQHFTLLAADLAKDQADIESWVAQHVKAIDLILHFASPASPKDYGAFPLESLAVNSAGTDLCCRLAEKYCSRMVYASTSEIYGDPLEHPQNERYRGNVNSTGARSCYDEAKRFGEALVSAYGRVQGVDTRIARIFNTYGPRMRENDGRVIPNFIADAVAGRPFALFGSGLQTRSFCYVDDQVEAIMRLAECDEARGTAVNLGNPNEISMVGLAGLVARAAGVDFHTVVADATPDDPARRCPDIALARKLLGWEPKIALEEGLRRILSDRVTHPAKAHLRSP